MPLDKADILRQIDEVLQCYQKLYANYAKPLSTTNARMHLDDAPSRELFEVRARLTHTIERFRPKGVEAYSLNVIGNWSQSTIVQTLVGLLTALRADYAADCLQSISELIHANLFADLLEQAAHLLGEGYKEAAAVTAGAVLEEHLRKLCGRHAVPTTITDAKGKERPKMMDGMNIDLTKARAYDKIQEQSVRAWAAIRNAAAHGEREKVVAEQVELMIQAVRIFIGRHPA